MAASIVYRCALLSRCRGRTGSPLVTGKRFILSSAYTSDSIWEKWEKEPHNLANLANQMDKNYERKFPVSSLTIAQFVDNIRSREEIDQAEYYLYKFRHSPNCWYLRDWTIHGWIRKCLKYGAPEKALYTLQNKVQYGIFPNDFTFNLLLDTFIKKENFNDAVSVVTEIMLQESFDNVSTQLLSLYALHKYLSGNPQLTWVLEKNLGASLLLAGMHQENTMGYSSQLYGNALLGKLELSQGLRAVYTQMPLIWKPGYFQRALDVMDKVSQMPGEIKITKDAIDILKSALDSAILSEREKVPAENAEVSEDTSMHPEDSEKTEADMLLEFLARFQDLLGKLESLDKIETTDLLNLTTHLVLEKLPECEKSDIEKYEAKLKEWQNDEAELIAREKELREKAKKEYEARQAAQSAAQ
ncbi:PREDICTED: 28S ribosomal protein S27, mitochondrial [Nanorana parkeri]|uniref:28S ribosomal protein S27, mitochondrial n=1 Tax=Nanorana parkeri TaxID=125878 RepID=UPI000854E6AE|nr:PREDICTED: 28S ribosomal protein S27, mitochondrial [Nanorana parkeri]